MDLNCLFHRHQLSLTASTQAGSAAARAAHRGLAAGYADKIAALRASTGGRSAPAARVS